MRKLYASKDNQNSTILSNWVIVLFLVLFLSAIGLLVLTSAGAMGKEPMDFATKQIKIMVIALCAGTFFALIDINLLKKLALPIAIISIILVLLVLIPGIGVEKKGAHRWIEIAGNSLQPSELTKIAIVICTAKYLQNNQRKMSSVVNGFLLPMAMLACLCLPIAFQPDFGTTAFCMGIALIVLFISGMKWKYISIMSAIGIVAISILIALNPNRMDRIGKFFDGKQEDNYQLNQASIALGVGGVEGAGIGQGRQHLAFLPESNTDFILAILAEELGLLGTLSVLLAFLFITIITLKALRKAPNIFEFSLALGALLMIVAQALFNLCVVTGTIPPKGIPLPFISSGGSNLLAMYMLVGILINCLRRWDNPKKISII